MMEAKRMLRIITALCLALAAPLLPTAGARAGEISMEALSALPPADVIFLGEVHDNPRHHEGQARAIRAIGPRAVVFEMLTPGQAARITPDLLADGAALGRALGWEEAGWPDFAIYYPIFRALGGARIHGAARPRPEARRAFEEGAAAVFGEGAARFGLDRALPGAELSARMDQQYEAHCRAMPREMMGGMVEAQRLRDAALAEAALGALRATGGPVVVITGNGHARKDWGAPALLKEAAPEISVLSVGFLEEDEGGGEGGGAAREGGENPPFDLWVVTEPAPRPDPCAGLRKGE